MSLRILMSSGIFLTTTAGLDEISGNSPGKIEALATPSVEQHSSTNDKSWTPSTRASTIINCRVVCPFHWLTEEWLLTQLFCLRKFVAFTAYLKATTSKFAVPFEIFNFRWLSPAPIEQAFFNLSRMWKAGVLIVHSKELTSQRLLTISKLRLSKSSPSSRYNLLFP